MALSTERLDSVRNTANQSSNPIEDLQQNVSSAIQDPFGAVITKVVTKIGQATITAEKLIDDLSKKIVESADSTGKVTLQGNTIVISITRENEAQAEQIKNSISAKIKSIQTLLTTLEVTLKTLQAVQTGIDIVRTALTIQETALSTNPASGPIFIVLKQGIKIIFLKEIVKEYSSILKRQVKANTKKIGSLSNKFRNLQISIVVQDEKNKGKSISDAEAESVLAQDLLNTGSTQDVSSVTEDFLTPKKVEYLLKVEKYQEKQLIGVAYEKESGLIKQQTSPSFFATPEELIAELKSILNLNS